METRVLHSPGEHPNPRFVQRAAEVLRAGGLVAFPTETVYGLGADATNPRAVERIYQAKGRPSRNPLIVHLGSADQARDWVTAWPPFAERLAQVFWPGPLTLVLPKSPRLPDIVTGGGATVGVRVPAHATARALLAAAGVPIAAPSANRSNRLSPTRAEHVLRDMMGRIEMILDGGPTLGGLESTVLDLTGTSPTLLRPGLITQRALEAVVGPIQAATQAVPIDQPLPAPGMLAQHYAPRTPLELGLESDQGRTRVLALSAQGQRVGWLPMMPQLQDVPPLGVVVQPLPADPTACAAELYHLLHELDQLHLDRLVVALPPAEEAWLAVRDRLFRAAAVTP
jgi:L-threonylcarbamoyladenylate synthase